MHLRDKIAKLGIAGLILASSALACSKTEKAVDYNSAFVPRENMEPVSIFLEGPNLTEPYSSSPAFSILGSDETIERFDLRSYIPEGGSKEELDKNPGYIYDPRDYRPIDLIKFDAGIAGDISGDGLDDLILLHNGLRALIFYVNVEGKMHWVAGNMGFNHPIQQIRLLDLDNYDGVMEIAVDSVGNSKLGGVSCHEIVKWIENKYERIAWVGMSSSYEINYNEDKMLFEDLGFDGDYEVIWIHSGRMPSFKVLESTSSSQKYQRSARMEKQVVAIERMRSILGSDGYTKGEMVDDLKKVGLDFGNGISLDAIHYAYPRYRMLGSFSECVTKSVDHVFAMRDIIATINNISLSRGVKIETLQKLSDTVGHDTFTDAVFDMYLDNPKTGALEPFDVFVDAAGKSLGKQFNIPDSDIELAKFAVETIADFYDPLGLRNYALMAGIYSASALTGEEIKYEPWQPDRYAWRKLTGGIFEYCGPNGSPQFLVPMVSLAPNDGDYNSYGIDKTYILGGREVSGDMLTYKERLYNVVSVDRMNEITEKLDAEK